MTEYRIVPRTESGLPAEVYNNDGTTLRPLMPRPIHRVAIHYTGSTRTFGTPTLDQAKALLRGTQANAQATAKSNEYNYCVTNTDDGTVLEYAGLRQAAHSPGENLDTLAILHYVGGCVYKDGKYTGVATEVPTDAMIDKSRWLIATLRALGVLSPDCEITQHRLLPGAATDCPGPAVRSVWDKFLVPWSAPEPPPPPVCPLEHKVTATEASKGWWEVYRSTHTSNPTVATVQPLIDANPGAKLTEGTYVNIPGELP